MLGWFATEGSERNKGVISLAVMAAAALLGATVAGIGSNWRH